MYRFAQLSIAAAIAVVGSGAVRADDASVAKSRAEVVAELNSARDSGAFAALHGEDSGSAYLSRQGGGGAIDRRAVREQTMAGRRSGEIDTTGEDSGSFALARAAVPSFISRAEVLAEMRRAGASGELTALHGEDSGSSFLSQHMPDHWQRYAGPSTGRGDPEQPLGSGQG